MKGIVLGYDAEAEAIVLRADNGRRYRFKAAEWRERTSPRKGDPVDFEPEGDRARDVYLAGPSGAIETATPAAPLSIMATWGPARFFMARPVLTCALLVLVACLTGAYAIGEIRISVFAAPELIARMSEALDSLIAVSGTDPSPRLGAGVARVLLVLLLGLYAVPALAALTLWREFVGKPDRRLARYAGIAAIVLPIVLPLIIILVVQVWVLPGIPDVGARLGRAGVTTPEQVFQVLRLYATGIVLLVASGAALWAAGAGRLSLSLSQRTIDEPRNVAAPTHTANPEMFAPSASRRRASPAPKPAGDAAGPVPFLKLGARRTTPVAPPKDTERPAARGPAAPPRDLNEDIAKAQAAETSPYLQAADAEAGDPAALPADAADLPPRGGSVWPEPTPYRAGDEEPEPADNDSGKTKP